MVTRVEIKSFRFFFFFFHILKVFVLINLKGKGANIQHMEQCQVKLREFNARRKMKAGAHAVIAVNDLIKKFKVNK